MRLPKSRGARDFALRSSGRGNLTYLALKTAVDKVAAAMSARGMGGGRLTVADFSRPELDLIGLFAASKIGADLAFAPSPMRPVVPEG